MTFFKHRHNSHKTLLKDVRFYLTLIKPQRILQLIHLQQFRHKVDYDSRELILLIVVKTVKIEDEQIGETLHQIQTFSTDFTIELDLADKLVDSWNL